jgi:hypothetical protein
MPEDAMIDLRISFLAAFSVLVLTAPAHAGPKRLTAAEITAVLSGNTLDGDRDGTAYRRYFESSGQLIYATPGGKPVNGTWHVSNLDQLCETLPPSSKEDCYDVFGIGITIFLVTPSSGLRHRAIVLAGNALDFSIVGPY